jgi:hypothetical protein
MPYSIPRLSRKTPVFVITVQWVANPIVPIRYTVYPTVCCDSRTKDRGMISSVHLFCSVHIFRRRFFLLIFDLF